MIYVEILLTAWRSSFTRYWPHDRSRARFSHAYHIEVNLARIISLEELTISLANVRIGQKFEQPLIEFKGERSRTTHDHSDVAMKFVIFHRWMLGYYVSSYAANAGMAANLAEKNNMRWDKAIDVVRNVSVPNGGTNLQ
jgi:hypothetical protein